MENEHITIMTAAISLHEMFISMVTAGFTEEQALELVKVMVTRTKGEN